MRVITWQLNVIATAKNGLVMWNPGSTAIRFIKTVYAEPLIRPQPLLFEPTLCLMDKSSD